MTAKCAAITLGGAPCKGLVRSGNEYCPAHDPARQEARRRAASKAGKSKPGREFADTKREIIDVIKGVREGSIERPVGAVVFQGYNTLLKAIEVERRIRETEELDARLEALEQQSQEGDSRRWGA